MSPKTFKHQLKKGENLNIFNLDFIVKEKIGGGSFGETWLITDTDKNSFILKSNKKWTFPITNKNHIMNRFVKEASTYLDLEAHPNIVIVYGIEKINNLPVIIMEYVNGGSLRNYIINNKKLNWIEILRIAIQIADGLAHLHNSEIIHRDLKPDNILIEKQIVKISNYALIVKIIDLGLVKQLSQFSEFNSNKNDSISKENNKHYFIGTRQYASPEQIWGVYDINKNSDIYSFGILLCELVTGQLPKIYSFYDKPSEPLIKIDDFIKQFIKEYRKDCSEILLNLIIKCLRYNPEDRWQEEKKNNEFKFFVTISEQLKIIYKQLTKENYIQTYE